MKISLYSIASSPTLGDKLIGTKVEGGVVNGTFNFTIQQLSDLISQEVTLQKVLNKGNTATQNINLTGNINTTNLFASNNLGIRTNTPAYPLDVNGNARFTGEVTGLLFQNSSQNAFYLTNSGNNDFTLTGSGTFRILNNAQTTSLFSVTNSGLTTVNNLYVTGAFRDSSNSVGLAGQVLSSTVTGTNWISLPATPNLQQVLNAGNSATQNISLNGSIGCSSLATELAAITDFGSGYLDFGSGLYDNVDFKPIATYVYNGDYTYGGGALVIKENNFSQIITIDSLGSILINATSSYGPQYKLQVNGASYFDGVVESQELRTPYVFLSQLSYGGGLYYRNNDQVIASFDNNNYFYGNGALVINGNNFSQIITIDSLGSILINTTSSYGPQYKLQVSGASYFDGNIFIPEDTAISIGLNSFIASDPTFGDNILRIISNNAQGLQIGTADSSISIGYTMTNIDIVSSDNINFTAFDKVNFTTPRINMSGLPTSQAGLSIGDLYRSGSVVHIVH
jgi:hypothetical protein